MKKEPLILSFHTILRGCALLLVAALLATGCAPRKPAAARPPEIVVLVAVDALRSDHLSCNNFKQPTSREIDAFAAEGIFFPTVYAPASWSAPSLASVLTGLSPREHGIRHGLLRPDGSVMGQQPLTNSITTLAERFAAAGYATCAVTASPHVTRELGFAQGFNTFLSLTNASAAAVTDTALQLLHDNQQKPLFLLVHYTDLQLPRQPREPFFERLGGKTLVDENLTGSPETLQQTFTKLIGRLSDSNQTAQANATIRLLRENLATIYDSNLAYVSQETYRLINQVPREKSLVALFGLCGEALLEHGLIGNGAHLYTEFVTVPLMIRDAGSFRGGRQIFGPLSLLDLPVTLGERMGWSDMPANGGVSLLETVKTLKVPQQRAIFLETSQPRDSSSRAVVAWPWKLTLHQSGGQMGMWLSHLGYDPGESKNLIGQQPAVAQELERVARQWWGM